MGDSDDYYRNPRFLLTSRPIYFVAAASATERSHVDSARLAFFAAFMSIGNSRDVLRKFVSVVRVVVMTELDGSDIAMGFPWLTDLVFFGACGIIGGINRSTRGQEWDMSISRRAII